MPSKVVQEVISRLIALEHTMQTHLIESGPIKNDIKWLKWFMGVLIVAILSLWLKR